MCNEGKEEKKMKTNKQFTIGICFSHDLKWVYLVRKRRPEWQAGKLNGIGGKVNPGEDPAVAMRREAKEEAMYEGDWTYFGTFSGQQPDPFTCYMFYSVVPFEEKDRFRNLAYSHNGSYYARIHPRTPNRETGELDGEGNELHEKGDEVVGGTSVEKIGMFFEEMVTWLPALITTALGFIQDKDKQVILALRELPNI